MPKESLRQALFPHRAEGETEAQRGHIDSRDPELGSGNQDLSKDRWLSAEMGLASPGLRLAAAPSRLQ